MTCSCAPARRCHGRCFVLALRLHCCRSHGSECRLKSVTWLASCSSLYENSLSHSFILPTLYFCRDRLLDHSCRHDNQRSEWTAAREEDIRRAYADKECWNDLDRITCQHPYNFNAIEQWPLDAAVICKPTDRASVLLGSIKAACSLEDIFKTLSMKVTVVVTMCANEMDIRGAPKDWARYFQQEKVFHVKCHLEDTTLKPPHRWEERIPDLVASCLEQWKIVCGQLWKQSMLAVTRGESMHVLFHCFGGINRSAGLEGLRTERHMELSAADGN